MVLPIVTVNTSVISNGFAFNPVLAILSMGVATNAMISFIRKADSGSLVQV